MKKLLLFYILVTFSYNSTAQDYKPLLDFYNEWNVRWCYFGCDTDVYYTNGDTIVDGIGFKILDGYHYISRGFLLREDVPDKKVYLKVFLPNGTFDYLLYDFALEVGDSIDIKNPYTPFPEDAGYYKVDSIIPRPLVDGNDYKHFYLSPSVSNTTSKNNAIWVEGVGSMSIVTAPGGDPDIDGVGRVACMFKNGISFYSDLEIIDECEPTFILDTSTYTQKKSTVKAISTTFSGLYELINIEDFHEIELYDIKGVKLDFFMNDNQNSIAIDLTKYPTGIYLLIFKSINYPSQNLKVIKR